MLEFEIDNEDKLVNLLKKCTEHYTNSDNLYILNNDDIDIIKEEFGIDYNNIEVTDEIYDNLNSLTKTKYPNNTFFKDTGFLPRTGKIKLPFIMGSMDELKEGDLINWKAGENFVVSAKLDGVSCGLVYKKGILTNAYSRGNGEEGQEILRHIYNLPSVPKRINTDLDEVKIRGELIVSKNNIPLMLDEIEQDTGKRLKNGRNSVAGYVNSKQGSKIIEKYLNFMAYQIIDFDSSEFNMYKTLELHEFLTPTYFLFNNNELNEDKLTQLVIDTKLNNDYECDGLIITQNVVLPGYEGYETGTFNPKKSRKYKIGAVDNTSETEIEDIEWNISKDGLLKPRVKIKPVDLVGVTINYATGHNYKNIQTKKIGIGSKITIKRSGDVIPYILDVLKESNNIPLPNCSYMYEINDKGEEVDLLFDFEKTKLEYDENIAKSYYNEMILQKLIYFCSKIKADFAGEGNLRILSNWFIEKNDNPLTIKDLILLDKNCFEELIGINGIKMYDSIHNILNSIEECVFMDAVNCFGRGIGELKLKKIFNKFETLCVSEEQLLTVDGWAEKSANQFISNINNYFDWKDWCKSNNIQFKIIQTILNSNELSHLNVCFTGVRDNNLENYIKSNGGKIASSVSKTCNLLICKSLSDNSTKLKKAIEKGIEIIDYDEALARFN